MTWRALVTMVDPAPDVRSRLPVYHHPLAGRPVVWHVLEALAATTPPPDEIVIVHREETVPILPPTAPVPIATRPAPAGEETATIRRTVGTGDRWLIADGLAPLIEGAAYGRLLREAQSRVAALRAQGEGPPLAVAGDGLALAVWEDPRCPEGIVMIAPGTPADGIRIDSRSAFSAAATRLRDRIVRIHQDRGVSFLLPETSWIDADVIIGADTLVYPSVVMEGQTEIGNECVIGPHCRLSDARLGRGVELKGFNYVTRTALRNHAVLEPYVRRGHD